MEPPKNAEIIEWPASTMWFDEDGILYSVSKKVKGQPLEDIKKTIEDLTILLRGKKVCLMVDATNATERSREVREYAAEELPKLVKAIAIISRSQLGKMIANMFFNIKQQPYPVKMFSDETEAREWLRQYL